MMMKCLVCKEIEIEDGADWLMCEACTKDFEDELDELERKKRGVITREKFLRNRRNKLHG